MIFKRILAAILTVFVLSFSAFSQKAEITISLNEQFFDGLLDGIYQHAAPPEFPLAAVVPKYKVHAPNSAAFGFNSPPPACSETIKLLRETNNLRTAVRFRDGKIYAPLAFSGSYNQPFIGCVEFSGYAETNIELEFDPNGQRLIARAKVLNVSMNGTGGIGGNVIARLVQSSIDKKVNPIEIIRMDKISFVIPIQNSGNLRMKAVGIRHEIVQGQLQIHIAYEFVKA
ncbi:MAG: hypothetical protein WKF92_05820 [Pyrinomonadaceae bacterium]